MANNLDDPIGVFKYTWSVMYCMSVSLAYAGMGLGTVWGEELAQKMMRASRLPLGADRASARKSSQLLPYSVPEVTLSQPISGEVGSAPGHPG